MEQKLKHSIDRFLENLAQDAEFTHHLDRMLPEEQEFLIDAVAYAYHCGWDDHGGCNSSVRLAEPKSHVVS